MIKVAISGRGKAGKTTASKMLAEISGLRYMCSTSQALSKVVFEKMIEKGHNFESVEECWGERASHRKEWGEIIKEYNQPDGVTLYTDMSAENDIFDGIRRSEELAACSDFGLVDVVIWIERDAAPDDVSLTYGMDACDIIIYNNSTLEELRDKLLLLWSGMKTWSDFVGNKQDQQSESMPEGWHDVRLTINPDTGEFYILDGPRADGDPGCDLPYPAVDAMVARIKDSMGRLAIKPGVPQRVIVPPGCDPPTGYRWF